ncbi:MAG: hypothetical protein MR051_07320 [Lentisphaeria bacterium]|nr:hypothetical protein [Lentisphaeria bacterium]
MPSVVYNSHSGIAYNHTPKGRVIKKTLTELTGVKLGVNIAFADGHVEKISDCVTTASTSAPADMSDKYYWWTTE